MCNLDGNEEFEEIVRKDDKEKFVERLSKYPREISMNVLSLCANMKARKCLVALLDGDGCISSDEIYAKQVAIWDKLSSDEDFAHILSISPPNGPTPLALVASYFHEATDIIQLLLSRGPSEHVNITCSTINSIDCMCPLDHLLLSLSYEPQLHAWAPGDSLIKLVLLLCQWKLKPSLDSARLLAPHTVGINDIAWSYVGEGRLASFAALLLVAHEKVFLPFGSGSTVKTIGQRITEMLVALRAEVDLDDVGAKYECMLIDACKLLDIFERAGGALSSYCSSINKYVPPHEVLIDAASILKKAGFALQPVDLDLRDCYRECPELSKGCLFKLSDPPSSNKEHLFPSSLTRAQGLGATRYRYPHVGECHFLHKVKLGPMVNFVQSAAMPRLFSIAAAQIDNAGSSIPLKHLAYITCRLKRGMKL